MSTLCKALELVLRMQLWKGTYSPCAQHNLQSSVEYGKANKQFHHNVISTGRISTMAELVQVDRTVWEEQLSQMAALRTAVRRLLD